MSRVLLVSPAFHGYWRAISAALEARGHHVQTHPYDELSSVSARAHHKLRRELPHRLGFPETATAERHMTQRAIDMINDVNPDVVVVVKGDTLGDDFYAAIGNRPRVLWLYDELRRTRWASRDLAIAGPVCSYSPADTQSLLDRGLMATHLPLAYDHRLVESPTRERNDSVVFIGARYPGREQALLSLSSEGVQVRAYGRDWSHHPWDRLRTWGLRRPALSSGRDLTRTDAYDAMAAAMATLNIHGDQDGFTMRTFEACGVGALQLIDRRDLAGLYDDGVELASYETVEELVELCRRASQDVPWTTRLRAAGRARTLAEHTFDQRIAVLEEAWA